MGVAVFVPSPFHQTIFIVACIVPHFSIPPQYTIFEPCIYLATFLLCDRLVSYHFRSKCMLSPGVSPLIKAVFEDEMWFDEPKYLRQIGAEKPVSHDVHLVMGGGGMKCAAGAGAMIGLLEKFHMRHPASITAASGSVGTANYFLAEQYERAVRIWAHHLSGKDFIDTSTGRIVKTALLEMKARLGFGTSPAEKRIIDVRHLIDTVFKQLVPLNANHVLNSPVDYSVSSTHADTGRVSFIGNKRGDQIMSRPEDVFDASFLAKALPIVFGQEGQFHGQRYVDSYNSSGVEALIMRAVRNGAERILALRVSDGTGENRALYQHWVRSRSKDFQHAYRLEEAARAALRRKHQRVFDHGGTFELDGSRVHVLSLIPSGVSTLTNDVRALRRAIVDGFEKVVTSPVLEGFLAA